MQKLKKGDKIRVKDRVEGRYSAYAGHPRFYLTPDLEATVIEPSVPKVRHKHGKHDTFVLVEFWSPVTETIEHAALELENCLRVLPLKLKERLIVLPPDMESFQKGESNDNKSLG